MTRYVAFGLVALVVGACTGSPGSPQTAAASSPPAATATVCDPTTTPILIAPDGAQLVLGNGPGGTSSWISADGMSYFLRQIGDCIWIIGHMPVGEGQPPFLSAFHGRFGTDFRIVGSFSDTTGVLVPGYDMGVLAFRITFEGDEVILVEDRTDSGPPGCTGGPGACPAVRELRRAH